MDLEAEKLMEDQLNLDIDLPEGENEVVIRHGKAPEVNEPQQVQKVGTIEAPLEFYKKMRGKEHMDFSNALVTYDDDPDDPEVVLYVNPNNRLATVITGTMLESDAIRELGINRNSASYDNLELARKLRMNRSLFDDMEVNTDLVHKLSEFTATIEEERKNHDDSQGTRRLAVERVCKTELPSDFDLKIPFFKGMEPQTVTVELMYQYQNETIRFWLESPELQEEKRKIANSKIHDVVGSIRDEDKDNMPIIHVT